MKKYTLKRIGTLLFTLLAILLVLFIPMHLMPGSPFNDEKLNDDQRAVLFEKSKLIIADECISALDVSIQAQVVNLMKDIQQETGTAYLFIAHDLSMVKYISDRIGVLHLGHLLETGTTEEIFSNPVHPYTRSLLSAIPAPNPIVEKQRMAESYDYKTSGIDYDQGTDHLVSGSHYVKCTDEEFRRWQKSGK